MAASLENPFIKVEAKSATSIRLMEMVLERVFYCFEQSRLIAFLPLITVFISG